MPGIEIARFYWESLCRTKGPVVKCAQHFNAAYGSIVAHDKSPPFRTTQRIGTCCNVDNRTKCCVEMLGAFG